MLDDFRNDILEDYLAGFPWHPHRGIETITYVLAGEVEHGDSMGNSGSIGARRCSVDDTGKKENTSNNNGSSRLCLRVRRSRQVLQLLWSTNGTD